MNICSLVGVKAQLCRRAFILAHSRLVVTSVTTVPVRITRRDAHNGLYQMVKKRTLEARTKQQADTYPNNHSSCLARTDNSSSVSPRNPKSFKKSKLINECTIPVNSMSSSSSSSLKHSPPKCTDNFPKVPTRPQDLDKDRCRPKFSHNAEVLRAANCNISRKASCEGKSAAATAATDICDKKPDKGDGGGGGGKDDKSDNTKTFIMALAATLGIGGALFYLMGGSKDNKVIPCPPGLTSLPATSADLPKHVPYLLIGGGTASFSAFRAIKSNDAKAKVLMITDEFRKPYMRPPLSKELWYSAKNGEMTKDYRFKQWTGAERSLYFEPEEFFVEPSKLMESVNGGIAVAQGFEVKQIDPTKRIATLSDGYEISYDECLIATGCAPKNLQIFSDAAPSVREKVMVYRTPEDFEKLKSYMDAKKNVTIIGNGFMGSELACSLANYNKNVTDAGRVFQIFQETGNMSKVLPDYLSKWTMEKVKSQGVCVLPGASVKSVLRDDSQVKLALSTGETILTDMVVVCVGCDANTSIANGSGLEIDRQLGGFVVNAELEARRNLFVAGDASCFYDPLLGRRRVEHHDHSVISGRLAGENMVGKKKPYTHQSMFWSDLGPEIGYEGIGLVDSSLPTVGVFALPSKADRQTDNLTEIRNVETPATQDALTKSHELPAVKCNEEDKDNYGRGVVFYLKDDKIVGILLWNIFNRIGLARTVINQNTKYADLNEVAKLFEIHS